MTGMIKLVSEIPQTKKDKGMLIRAALKADIEEAMHKGYEKFEFDGEYNWNNLTMYANEVADALFSEYVEKESKELYNLQPHDRNVRFIIVNRLFRYEYINIISRKAGLDRVHVYCSINYKNLASLPEKIKRYFEELKERDRKKNLRQNMEGSK